MPIPNKNRMSGSGEQPEQNVGNVNVEKDDLRQFGETNGGNSSGLTSIDDTSLVVPEQPTEVTEAFKLYPDGIPKPYNDHTYEFATLYGDGVLFYDHDGTWELRSGGDLSWRINNPFNVMRGYGLGTYRTVNGSYSIFGSSRVGFETGVSCIRENHFNKTIQEWVNSWTPKGHGNNDPVKYAAAIGKAIGQSTDVRISDLSDDVFIKMVNFTPTLEGKKGDGKVRLGNAKDFPLPDLLARVTPNFGEDGVAHPPVDKLPATDSDVVEPPISSEDQHPIIDSISSTVVRVGSYLTITLAAGILLGFLTGIVQDFARKRRFKVGAGGVWTFLATIPSLKYPYPLFYKVANFGPNLLGDPVGSNRLWGFYKAISLVPALIIDDKLRLLDGWGGWTRFHVKSSADDFLVVGQSSTEGLLINCVNLKRSVCRFATLSEALPLIRDSYRIVHE